MWFSIPLRAKLKPLSIVGWSTENEQKEMFFGIFPNCAIKEITILRFQPRLSLEQ